jgi:Protein of unknown function (DUF1573)
MSRLNQFKKYLFLTLLVGGFMACSTNQEKAGSNALAEKMPKIEFKDNVKDVDFGSMTEGDTVQRAFRFTNTGEFPLIINNVSTSCGCTVPQWPRDPIAPGEGSQILVRFNSKGKLGPQFKTVSIYANTDPAVSEIKFKAEVNAKADSTAN